MSDPQATAVKTQYDLGPCISACREKVAMGQRVGLCYTCVQELRAQLRLDLEALQQERDTLKEANRQLEILRECDRQDGELLDQLQDNGLTVREGLETCARLRAALEKQGSEFEPGEWCCCGFKVGMGDEHADYCQQAREGPHAMTDPSPSLAARVRALADQLDPLFTLSGPLLRECAEALEAKDTEIEGLKAVVELWTPVVHPPAPEE